MTLQKLGEGLDARKPAAAKKFSNLSLRRNRAIMMDRAQKMKRRILLQKLEGRHRVAGKAEAARA